WRDDLQKLHVSLLRFVPEDTFVARLENVSLATLKNLPFVHWVGEYRPDHKLHTRLRPSLADTNSLSNVRVLLSPRLSGRELLLARLSLQKVVRQSKSRFGLVLDGKIRG